MSEPAPASPATPPQPRRWGQIFRRVLLVIVFALAMGWAQGQLSRVMHRSAGTAGFVIGLVDGGTMPLALPTLLVGDNPPLFATDHNGRPYKIGFILGINLIGLIFFGFLFTRLERWRRRS